MVARARGRTNPTKSRDPTKTFRKLKNSAQRKMLIHLPSPWLPRQTAKHVQEPKHPVASQQPIQSAQIKDLFFFLHEHFLENEMSNVQGFRYLDKDNNGKISAKEIVQALKEAGASNFLCSR
eukprot:scaffold4475_cov277-Chaetoceros_neogracile.AAC.22